VSIRLQEFPHWIFLSHCRLLTSSANLRVTTVRLQPSFNVVQNGCGERRSQSNAFPPHDTPENVPQPDQVCRSRWRVQSSFLNQSQF